jgi:hypothetical protein
MLFLFFTGTKWVTIGPENNVYVSQMNRLFVFDNDGQYLDAITLCSNYRQVPLRFFFISEKQVIAKVHDSSVPGGKKPKYINEIMFKRYIGIYDLDKNTRTYLSEIYKYPLGSFGSFLTYPVVKNENEIFFSIHDQDNYEILKYSYTGELIKTITKDYKPVKFLPDEIERMKKGCKMIGQKLGDSNEKPIPIYYDSIHFFLVDSYNYLWVFTNERKKEKLLSVDLYNEKDELIKTMFFDCEQLLRTGSDRLKIHGKYAYAIILGENDEEKFVRFRLPDEIWN